MAVTRLSRRNYTTRNYAQPGALILGATVANANTVSLPDHQAGDWIVLFARASAVNTLPSVPTSGGTVPTWTSIVQSSLAFNTYANNRVAYAVATASNTTSGTWTNADGLIAVVVRRATAVGSSAATNGGPGVLTAPAVQLSIGNNTSCLLHFYGWGDGVNSVTSVGSVPTGYTRLATLESTANKILLAANVKNTTFTDGAVTQAATHGAWCGAATVELVGA